MNSETAKPKSPTSCSFWNVLFAVCFSELQILQKCLVAPQDKHYRWELSLLESQKSGWKGQRSDEDPVDWVNYWENKPLHDSELLLALGSSHNQHYPQKENTEWNGAIISSCSHFNDFLYSVAQGWAASHSFCITRFVYVCFKSEECIVKVEKRNAKALSYLKHLQITYIHFI